jgi:hypothetical protein
MLTLPMRTKPSVTLLVLLAPLPATSLVLLQAQQKLNENAAVMSPRYATVNPAANAGLVEGMKGLFNPTDTISKQFKNGMMGTGVLGFDEVNMSQSIKQHTTGSRSASAATGKTPGVTPKVR